MTEYDDPIEMLRTGRISNVEFARDFIKLADGRFVRWEEVRGKRVELANGAIVFPDGSIRQNGIVDFRRAGVHQSPRRRIDLRRPRGR